MSEEAEKMSDRVVIETPDEYMIRCTCRGPDSWHGFPKRKRPGASWTFNGDFVKPTFAPSLNECLNPSNSPHFNPDAHLKDFRCHFVVTAGVISYCGDCTNESLRNTKHPLKPWSAAKVKYYELMMEGHRAQTAPPQT